MALELGSYLDFVAGCRFCPMCKPASEVGTLTHLESHTTRFRALLLWRFIRYGDALGRRERELLFQSTLDSISQAWCVSGYPVSEYLLAARRMLFRQGQVPGPVKEALRRLKHGTPKGGAMGRAGALFLASEITEAEAWDLLDAAEEGLRMLGVHASTLKAGSGVPAYCLGDWEQAGMQAEYILGTVRDSGALRIIADGPQTLWALRRVYPQLGLTPPEGIDVLLLADCLRGAMGGAMDQPAGLEQSAAQEPVLFHDSRSAFFLCDQPAQPQAIQPGFQGSEEALGRGEIYDSPRRMLKDMGKNVVSPAWSRSLCKSCGADDGLCFTYPDLAAGLAHQRMEEAGAAGAGAFVSDSPLCVSHMRKAMEKSLKPEDMPVGWLPEMMIQRQSAPTAAGEKSG